MLMSGWNRVFSKLYKVFRIYLTIMQKIIHEMYLRRELILISENLSSDTLNAHNQEQNAENIIESTEKSFSYNHFKI